MHQEKVSSFSREICDLIYCLRPKRQYKFNLFSYPVFGKLKNCSIIYPRLESKGPAVIIKLNEGTPTMRDFSSVANTSDIQQYLQIPTLLLQILDRILLQQIFQDNLFVQSKFQVVIFNRHDANALTGNRSTRKRKRIYLSILIIVQLGCIPVA